MSAGALLPLREGQPCAASNASCGPAISDLLQLNRLLHLQLLLLLLLRQA